MTKKKIQILFGDNFIDFFKDSKWKPYLENIRNEFKKEKNIEIPTIRFADLATLKQQEFVITINKVIVLKSEIFDKKRPELIFTELKKVLANNYDDGFLTSHSTRF